MASWARRCTQELVEEKESYTIEQLYDSSGQPVVINDKQLFDIVVIGSGPASITLVTRFLEDRPAAIYLEDERHHLHWLKRSKHAAPTIQTSKPGKTSDRVMKGLERKDSSLPRESMLKILVLDKLGDGWLGQWRRNFKALEIPYLRSPMFFHTDPSDLDGLLEYAVQTQRDKSAPHTIIWDLLTGQSMMHRKKGQGRQEGHPDLLEVPGVVGKEISKHKWKQSKYRKHANLVTALGPIVNERDRRDYQNPSTKLFHDFTDYIVDRYHIHPPRDEKGEVLSLSNWLADDNAKLLPTATLLRGEIQDMDYGRLQVQHIDGSQEDVNAFSIKTRDQCHIAARYVVSAVGYGGRPSIPPWLMHAECAMQKKGIVDFVDLCAQGEDESNSSDSDSDQSHHSAGSTITNPSSEEAVDDDKGAGMQASSASYGEGWAHSSAICTGTFAFPQGMLAHRVQSGQTTTVLVVGGGLSSAQICDLCIRRGITKVIFLLRGFFKVKPFDFSIDWVGKYANINKMSFWQTDDAEGRMQMIDEGRNGGSINPPYARVLQQHAKNGRLEIRTHTEVEKALWDNVAQKWKLTVRRQEYVGTENQFMNNPQKPGTIEACEVDYIISATGSQLGFGTLPFMQRLSSKMHVPEIRGIPIVNEDLQYGTLPLYVIGSYSALQIGPTAFNLGGIREAADRVVMKIRDMEEGCECAHEETDDEGSIGQYAHFLYHHLSLDSAE